MSYYYKYNFVSPEPIYSNVKEEFKTYFDTGAVDDLLFPTYVDKCLRKLGKSSYIIIEEVLHIEDFQARLPDNFYAVREAWMCVDIKGFPYRSANSFYSQASSVDTIQVSPLTIGGKPCTNDNCSDASCDGSSCMPERIQAVYKTNNEINVNYQKGYLLSPGNISSHDNCSVDCKNIGSSSADSFDIRDNKFVTNFRHGLIHLVFYGIEYDSSQNQMVPDNYRVAEFIEAFLKFKMIELLTNQVNDETFNQLSQKLVYYKQLSDEAYIMAEMEVKKQDANTKFRNIKRQKNSLNKYQLPGSNPWGRNRTV